MMCLLLLEIVFFVRRVTDSNCLLDIVSAISFSFCNWLPAYQAYFPFFLGVYLDYISQVPLQVGVAAWLSSSQWMMK